MRQKNVRRPAQYRAVALALGCCAVLPFWVGDYMPLADLPQHAAQISIAQHWSDPDFGYQMQYSVNWYSSQLLAYNITRAFAVVLPLTSAIKLVLSLAVLALAASVDWLVRTMGGDRWWGLLAFPLGFGFSMYWGMYNYVVAIPVGIVLIIFCLRYASAPSLGRAGGVLLGANVLFFIHSLILAYAGLVSVSVIAARAPGLRNKLLGWAALASVLPTVALWWSVQGARPSTATTLMEADLGAHRLRHLFAFQVSAESEPSFQTAVGLGLLLLPFALGARFSRERWRYLPLLVTLAVFALAPRAALDIDLIYERFAVFVLPALLCALEPGVVGSWRRLAVGGLVGAQLLGVAWAFFRFDREARSLDDVLAKTEPHKRLLYMPVEQTSRAVPHEVYSHFGSWYQVRRGGVADFSFAELYPAWYRYRPGSEPNLPKEFDSHADHFRYDLHDGQRYDYFLAHGPVVPEWFVAAPDRVRRIMSIGEWTLFGRAEAPAVHALREEPYVTVHAEP